MSSPFLEQVLALTMRALSVLFIWRRRLNDRPHPTFATTMGQQSSQQRLSINAVGLYSASTPVNMYAGWVNHVVLNIRRREYAMKPKAIVAGLIARGDSDHGTQRLRGSEL
jgi:hypothetical protein